jgi:hypothetical protein
LQDRETTAGEVSDAGVHHTKRENQKVSKDFAYYI